MAWRLLRGGGGLATARCSDPVTSHEAAGSISEEHTTKVQENILGLLRSRGALDFESLIEAYWGEYPGGHPSEQSIRTRTRELVRKGLVRDSGRKVRTWRGRAAIVWEATE